MSFIRATVQDAAVGVAVTEQSKNLSDFLMPGCAAAIWRKQMPADFQSWIDNLDPTHLPQGRIIVRPETVRSAVEEICDLSQTPICQHRDQLIDDIVVLADIFAGLMQPRYLRMRLDVVTSNACRKFHIDAITSRLVCTYRGTGTQYGISTNGDDPTRVFTVPTGAPILLRGTLWPEKPASGLLHRSPPIEGTGETRLVLVLDAMSDLVDDT